MRLRAEGQLAESLAGAPHEEGTAILLGVPFAVLYVCTGNVCRSPMAELLMRAWGNPRADLVVGSAGLQALVDRPIDEGSAAVLAELGVNPARHRARQFEPWMAAEADLVLTAERAHREQIMTRLPSAFRRTFTIKEFARILPRVEPGGDRPATVAAAAAHRALAPQPSDPQDDDVADPYRLPARYAATAATEIGATVKQALAVFGAVPEPARPRRPMPYPR